jgi:hypothetical protein
LVLVVKYFASFCKNWRQFCLPKICEISPKIVFTTLALDPKTYFQKTRTFCQETVAMTKSPCRRPGTATTGIVCPNYFVWIILSELFCLNYFVRIILSELFCPNYFVRIILSELFYPNYFVRIFLSELFCPNFFIRIRISPKKMLSERVVSR